MNTPKPPANIEDLAAKFQGADNLTDARFTEALQKEPRLRELLLWLQWLELQPGGMEKFGADLLEQFLASFGPAFLHTDDPQLTPLQRDEAFASLSAEWKQRLIPRESWRIPDACDWRRFSESYPLPEFQSEKKNFAVELERIDPKQIRDAFIESAKNKLPGRLRAMCDPQTPWSTPAPWYCKELMAVLFEAMDAHARAIELSVAHTKLVAILFEKMDFAWSARKFIRLDGDSRTGKSEAVKAWCNMFPGRARLVNTPPGFSMRDIYTAAAEALGVPFTPKTPIHVLKEKVQFVIRHAGLFLIFDEAHRLLPPPASTVATPARLEWVRANVIDRRLPVAFVTTPQSFKHAIDGFRKKTAWNFDQFFGRVALTVKLPAELDREDLLEVVRVHGAGIPEQFHRRIANEVIIVETYIRAIEDVCDRARHLAKLDARETVIESDIETALSEVIPGWTAPRRSAPAPSRPLPAAATPADGRNRIPQPAPALELPAPRQTSLTTVNT